MERERVWLLGDQVIKREVPGLTKNYEISFNRTPNLPNKRRLYYIYQGYYIEDAQTFYS